MNKLNTNKYIAIGADHAAFLYKTDTVKWLNSLGYKVKDFGLYEDKSVDYPDYAHPVASAIENEECGSGILFCGSANGVAITANKHQKVRAAIAWQNDVAKLARQHNDANILCIPARFVSFEMVKQMITIFLDTEFEGGRHLTRVNKISCR
jgi:ribose 5-phosphate isomerase B